MEVVFFVCERISFDANGSWLLLTRYWMSYELTVKKANKRSSKCIRDMHEQVSFTLPNLTYIFEFMQNLL